MERVPVSSSNIAAIGYDNEHTTLEIEFKNGSIYQYFDVPQHIYDALLSSDSVGGYLATNIKGAFRFSKV